MVKKGLGKWGYVKLDCLRDCNVPITTTTTIAPITEPGPAVCGVKDFRIDNNGGDISDNSCVNSTGYRIDWQQGILPQSCRKQAVSVTVFFYGKKERYSKGKPNPHAETIKRIPSKNLTPILVPFSKIKNNYGKPL